MKVHHIAYAVSDIVSASESFARLGYIPEGGAGIDDLDRQVKIAFMRAEDGTRIELVAPLNVDSPITAQLERSRGASIPYHVCYEVDNIESTLDELVSGGVLPVSGIAPAPAIAGRNVCFAFGRNIGLLELVESE